MHPCQRCQGLLVPDYYLDMQNDDGTLWHQGFRCVSCSERIDAVFLRNRARQSSLRLRLLQPVAVSRAAAGSLILRRTA